MTLEGAIPGNKGVLFCAGKVSIPTQETRTNAAFGTMPTPDQVAGIVLPTDGLIVVAYQALWNNSVAGAARAALFLGAAQVTFGRAGNVPAQVDAGPITAGTTDNPLATSNYGLVSTDAAGTASEVTTGQIVGMQNPSTPNALANAGGPCYIFAAAGTYTLSVQFKASSGNVVVQKRHLWVWTMDFS